MDIDPKVIDVDFVQEAPQVGRLMGALPRESLYGQAGIPRYRDVESLIPQSEWPGLIQKYASQYGLIAPHISRVYDQNGEPSCVSNAFCLAHEIVQAKMLGKENVWHLSAINLYERVGSRFSGSSLDANMREMTSRGVLPLDDERNKARFKHTAPANGYGRAHPSGWEETGKLFQNAEWADVDGIDELMTALLRGHPVIYARSGHCILGVLPVLKGSTLYCGYANSWGQWGAKLNEQFDYGLGLDSQRIMNYGGMALRSIKLPPELL